MVEVDAGDVVFEYRVGPSTGAHDLASNGDGEMEQALFVCIAAFLATGQIAEAGRGHPFGAGDLAPVLPAQTLRVTQVFGAGDGGEDPGSHGSCRSHSAEGQCGIGESRDQCQSTRCCESCGHGSAGGGTALEQDAGAEEVPAHSPGEHDRARGSCRVTVTAGAPGTQHRLVDAVGHEHPIDRRGLPAFVLPQRLPLRHRFTSTRVGHAFGPVPAGHRLRGMRTATPSAVFGKPFGSLGRTV